MEAPVQHDIIFLDPTIPKLVNKSLVIWQAETQNEKLPVSYFDLWQSFQLIPVFISITVRDYP